ncbi:MAG: aminotransferase class V-fold PLP-dependent enzyme [Pseudanabaenaceae cyanobacterium bins.68]|nr:aminotransferase class V-fold PLP-dependent enzyme [Pseudanabaenaceae cyanobacterium bins.68]
MPNSWQQQFVDPAGNNLEQLRQQGYAFVDLIVDQIFAQSSQPFVQQPSLAEMTIPELGLGFEQLLTQLRSQILPGALNLYHPGYMGHMDSMPLAITVWADALAAALQNNMLSSELAPVFTQLEAQLINWFVAFFGLAPKGFGSLVAGGSLANLTALLVARNRYLPDYADLGAKHTAKLVAFVSEAAHNSFTKAMNVLGLGRQQLIRIPTNNRGEIDLVALEQAISQAQVAGQLPFAVVGIAGTTVTGAIDPLSQMAAIAKNYNCWFHVDAAYGGAAQFSPQYKHLLQGIELADSITFNPQKWMWISRTCAMILVRDRQDLERAFNENLPYMSTGKLNFGNLTLQGTRRTDSLKLWLGLQALGTRGYGDLIEHSMVCTDRVRQLLGTHLELLCEPTLNILCWRDRPGYATKWIRENKLWLSRPLWQNQRVLKAVVLHPYPDLQLGN